MRDLGDGLAEDDAFNFGNAKDIKVAKLGNPFLKYYFVFYLFGKNR